MTLDEFIQNDQYVVISTVIIFIVIMVIVVGRGEAQKRSKQKLLQEHGSRQGFVVENSEDLGDGLVQFHGVATGSTLRPGMTFVLGAEKREVMEVYDGTAEYPDQPVPELIEGHSGTIVFRGRGDDVATLKAQTVQFITIV